MTKKPTLLVIDDEPALGGFAAHVGRRAGFDVDVVLDADRFQESYARSVPDAVVLDLGMPDGDGHDVMRFLADKGFGGAVLIISGFERPRLEASFRYGESLGLRMLKPLSKPVRLQDLDRVLVGLSERHDAGRPS